MQSVKNWVAQFKRGDFSTCDVPHPGQPRTATTPEIIYQIHEPLLEDSRILAKSIAEQLGIPREQVGSIIHEDLDMRRLSAKWVLKCLNVDQKRQQCQPSEQMLEFFRRNPNDFLSWLVSMDETWLYHYDTETKQQSMEWRHSGSPHPKKFRVQKSTGKVLASILRDQDDILLIDYLPKGQTINTEYYLTLLVKLKDILKEKHQVHQGGLVLARQCPGSPGTCNPEENGLPVLQLSWSPTLFSGSGPVGLPPVPWTEKTIEKSPFLSDVEVIAATET